MSTNCFSRKHFRLIAQKVRERGTSANWRLPKMNFSRRFPSLAPRAGVSSALKRQLGSRRALHARTSPAAR